MNTAPPPHSACIMPALTCVSNTARSANHPRNKVPTMLMAGATVGHATWDFRPTAPFFATWA
eukprot:2163484-Alexandrium_andersonii.AAC.1